MGTVGTSLDQAQLVRHQVDSSGGLLCAGVGMGRGGRLKVLEERLVDQVDVGLREGDGRRGDGETERRGREG